MLPTRVRDAMAAIVRRYSASVRIGSWRPGRSSRPHEVGNLGERPLGQFMPHAAHDRGLLGHDHELPGVDEEARGVAQAAVAERIVSAVPAVLAISRDVDRPWRSVPHIR